MRGFRFLARPTPGVRPGGRPTFLCGQESRQRNRPCSVAPSLRYGVPCDARAPRLARNSLRYAPFRQPREVRPRSALRARLGALCFSAPPKGNPETAQQPTAKPEIRSHRGIPFPPFSTAEERKVLRPCAQRTSRTDFARLSERSVAKRVPREASRPEYRREPAAQRRAVRSGVVSLPTFLSTQESRSPAGANSPLGFGTTPQHQRQARSSRHP
jgi:hypothetical protein